MQMFSDLSEESIRTRLLQRKSSKEPNRELHRKLKRSRQTSLAAVLVPLLKQNQDWYLLFIRRSHVQNDVHSGQVAFPGGRLEPNERSLEATALRETYEEIGMPPEVIRVLGHLDPLETATGFIIYPIVGLLPWPYELKPSPQEVSRVFTIPLSWLAQPDNRQIHFMRLSLSKKAFPIIYFKPYDGEVLWGASARITLDLLESLQII